MEKNEVFEAHPNLESYHQTSDGTPFFTAHDANAHARSLKNKHVEEIKNPNLIDTLIEEVETDETAAADIDGIGAADADLHEDDTHAAGSDVDKTEDTGNGSDPVNNSAANSASQTAPAAQKPKPPVTPTPAEIAAKKAASVAKAKATREAKKHAPIQAEIAADASDQPSK